MSLGHVELSPSLCLGCRVVGLGLRGFELVLRVAGCKGFLGLVVL